MKKSIYILPLAYIVIESPLQIGNVILTPSLKVIESGHCDIKTTMDIYKHITKSSREKLADEFQKHINF
ncbi:hypothetical protein ACJRFT_000549 [Staphylococcus aureus]